MNFRPLIAIGSKYIFKLGQCAMVSLSQPGTASLTESFFTAREDEEYDADSHETPTRATFSCTERVCDNDSYFDLANISPNMCRWPSGNIPFTLNPARFSAAPLDIPVP